MRILFVRGAQAVVDFLVPNTCNICGTSRDEDPPPPGTAGLLHRPVEVRLLGSLRIQNHPFCGTCLRRLEPSSSRIDLLHVGDLRVIAPFRTNATLLAISHRIKFSRFSSLCGPLVDAVGEAWESAGEPPPDAIVAVPMDRRSRRSRGFNPAELIALGLAERIGVDLETDALRKVKRTRAQSLMPREKRQDNVLGAFEAVPGRLAGKRVLLVDDLVTTGATALACAAALARAGVVTESVCCAGEAL